ncbi:MAG: sensor histidine kinase [Aggregatilineales bacterium]
MSSPAANNASSVTPHENRPDLLAAYEHLLEIGQQLNSTLDLSTLLHKIISAAEELTNTEASSILLLDPRSGDLRFEITSNLQPNQTESIVIPVEGSTAGWIVKHGEPRVIEDVTREPSHYQGVDNTVEFTTRNLLGVPMRAHNRVIGVLEALNKRNGEPFNEHDVKTLTILASQAAIAIQNARLFQQSDFIAEMVHELRTPLLALKASTALLLRPDLPQSRVNEIILSMQAETDRLIQMINDFLDLARLESGRTHLDITVFELDQLLRESLDIVLHQAEEKHLTLHFESQSFRVRGDRGKLKQVILNLLTNAIKYNRDGGSVTVRARLSSEYDRPFVELSVSDSGYGISSEDQKNMFQKFYRAADTASFTQGTGLGLVIAKHIIEAHGGHIWLESKLGVGSTFFVTIPCVPDV